MSPVPANNREPNKSNDDTDITAGEAPQFIVDNSDSDSEFEDDNQNGYQLLPQDLDAIDDGSPNVSAANVVSDVASVVDPVIMATLDNEDMIAAVAGQQEEARNQVPSETTAVWNAPPPDAASTPMDQEQADKIRAAMSGFTLPASAQPEWASHMSDDDWKQLLLKVGPSGMACKTQHSSRPGQQGESKDKTVER